MINYFLKKKTLVHVLTILIVFGGLYSMFHIKRSTYPDVEFDIMMIQTTYPGASAEDVEINVTKKIEDEIKEVRDVEKYLSNSIENFSVVYVWIDQEADDRDQVKDDIRRAVDQVTDLPKEVTEKPKVEELKSSNVAVLEVAISGTAEEFVLRKFAKDVEDDIKEINGVGSVEKVGYRDREARIYVDLKKLDDYYLSIDEVMLAIQNRNVRDSGGTLESFTDEKKIVTFSEFGDVKDVEDVILRKTFQGKSVRLKDVARVIDGFEDFDVIQRAEMKNSINLLIRSQSNADIIDISQEIQSLLQRANKNKPEGVNINLVIDYSRYTESLLSIVLNNAVIGFLLVLIVLFVFLDRTTAFWTALGIPVSFLGALIFFPVFNIDINFISLITLVLVLGMLVDDAIVVAENISRHREMGKNPMQAAIEAVKEVVWPVTTTVTTTIVAFMSLYFMIGVSGKFVRQIPYVVILALGMSLFESLFMLPSHVTYSKFHPAKNLKWFDKLKEKYGMFISWVVGHRAKTLVGFIGFLILSFGVFFGLMRVELFPYDDVDVFYVVAEMPEGTSLEQTADKMKEVEELVDTLPRSAMQNYTTIVGHHDRDVYGVTAGLKSNWALVTVVLKPARDRDFSSEDLIQKVEKGLLKIEGFKRLETDKFNDGPPVGKPITMTFVSNDNQVRRQFADDLMTYLKSIPGTKSLEMDEILGKKELRLKPDYEKMAELQINSAQLARTIRAAFNGLVVTDITKGGEDIEFRVQLAEEQRTHLETLQELTVLNGQGKLIPIGEFTDLEEGRGYQSIRHYNGRRSITITGDVDNTIITGQEVNDKIYDQFEEKVKAVPGLRMIVGGEEKATQESMLSFAVALVISLIIIYFLLTLLFDSFMQPLIIVSVVPFGLAGVIWTFFVNNMPLSFLGIIGTLGLLGVMVNDSLVMVSHLKDLKVKHGKEFSLDHLKQGCLDRLRPVILTTVTTVVGLIPTILGVGGYEPFVVPLVLSLAGGLVFATPITLVLVPTLYSLFAKKDI